MFGRHLTKTIFGIQKNTNKHLRQLDSTTQELLDERRTLRREVREKEQNNLPAEMNIR